MKPLAEYEFKSDEIGDTVTVRGYFEILAWTVWCEGEGFSGKRPFGNSGWESEVYEAMAAGGYIQGIQDEDGYWDISREECTKADLMIKEEVLGC